MVSRHESTVNFRNLIRDLADMYPQEVDEVVVVELIANALDAKAKRISIDYSRATNILTITDDGQGMDEAQFAQYHDFAAGLKTRGSGIGFAGVGAKISFNVANRVVTETASHSFRGGSNWQLEANGRLYWDDIMVTSLPGTGTRVTVHFDSNSKPSYTNTGDLIKLLQRNYLPLLDGKFLDLYQRLGVYSPELRFVVNGQELAPTDVVLGFIKEAAKELYPESAGRMTGFGVLGLAGTEYPLGEGVGGVLLCTYGKVIKGDLFNQFPAVMVQESSASLKSPDSFNSSQHRRQTSAVERGGTGPLKGYTVHCGTVSRMAGWLRYSAGSDGGPSRGRKIGEGVTPDGGSDTGAFRVLWVPQ